jgi:hypothetical protein
MTKTKVFNPGSTSVVYDDEGHTLYPSEWAELDATAPRAAALLEDGTLIIPATPPKATSKRGASATEDGEK